MVLVCHAVLQDHVVKGDVTFKVGTHQGKLSCCQVCSHSHSGCEYIIIFVCHATLQDHVIKA